MKVGICAVGSVLVAGDRTTVWLTRRLIEVGLDVAWRISVGDEHDHITAALRWLTHRCEAVAVIGGLGATSHDLTPSVVAEVAGVPLERLWKGRGAIRWAALPAGSVAFDPIGTTLAFALDIRRPVGGSAVVYALPGTSFELRAMTERDVLPDLARRRVHGFDEEPVEQTVAQLLQDSHLTIATAESCTAGAVMTRLAAVPGASAYLRGGVVAYATDVKYSVLGLEEQLVDEHGPVSIPTTEAMARRARELFDADFGLGVTCVAGPDTQGGRRVGTIVWALATRDGDGGSGELELVGDRPSIQRRAAEVVLEAMRRHLLRTGSPGRGGG